MKITRDTWESCSCESRQNTFVCRPTKPVNRLFMQRTGSFMVKLHLLFLSYIRLKFIWKSLFDKRYAPYEYSVNLSKSKSDFNSRP